MKKMLLFVVISMTIFMAACGSNDAEGSSEATETEDGKQIVTFWHAMGGASQEALDKIVASYNESQDEVEVRAEFRGTYDEALTKFHSVAGTDSAPTMIQVFEIGTMSMVNSGHIEPIQKFIDEDGYDMGHLEENIVNYYKIDDQFYSMPFNSSTPVMFYNKDAFEEAGLDPENPPQTFEEVEAASKAIVESNPEMKGFAPGVWLVI